MKKTKKNGAGRPSSKIDLLQDGEVAMRFDNINELAEYVGLSTKTVYKYICCGIPVQRATPLCNAVWTAAWEKPNKHTRKV